MGKKKHSKDPMYVTATEWKDSYGGKKNRSTQGGYQLPFDACAMTLGPFETPVCSGDGVVFDILNVVPYIKKYHKNPVTGEAMSSKDLIRLNFAKNADGKFHCPVTCKVFNDNSKIVAIGTTGNVFAAEAVQELNVKAKNWAELLTGDPFTRKDIIKIYDKTDAELCARRDVSNFVHLKEVREDSARAASAASHTSKIRQNRTTSQVFQEIDAVRSQEAAEAKKKLEEDAAAVAEAEAQGIALGHRIWHRAPHKLFTSDFKEGSEMTTGAASHSFTSSAVGIATVNAMRQPTLDEINDARWSRLRALKKKAYVRLETSYGNINVEVHCDFVPRTAENFIALCERGYYDGCKVHRRFVCSPLLLVSFGFKNMAVSHLACIPVLSSATEKKHTELYDADRRPNWHWQGR
jgi:peptidyl-prolyl cis-trans isomerase-like protein 2